MLNFLRHRFLGLFNTYVVRTLSSHVLNWNRLKLNQTSHLLKSFLSNLCIGAIWLNIFLNERYFFANSLIDLNYLNKVLLWLKHSCILGDRSRWSTVWFLTASSWRHPVENKLKKGKKWGKKKGRLRWDVAYREKMIIFYHIKRFFDENSQLDTWGPLCLQWLVIVTFSLCQYYVG